MFVGIDPLKTLELGQRMQTAATGCETLGSEVEAALQLSELTSAAPGRLAIEGTDLELVGLVLASRAKLADGFDIDVDELARVLGLPEAAVRAAVDDLQDPNRDPDANPLLGLVAGRRGLFAQLPTSIRDQSPDFPAEGTDPDLDAAVARFDNDLLLSIQNGERIDPDDLTKQQRADLRLITAAMGGDAATVRVTRQEKFRGAGGDDEYRNVTRDIPITDLDPAIQLEFVTLVQTGVDDSLLGASVDGGIGSLQTGDGNSVRSGSGRDVGTGDGDDGSRRIDQIDPLTGNRVEGTATPTDGGYRIDTQYTRPDGQQGQLSYDVDLDNGTITKSETFPDGTTRTTVRDQFGQVVSDEIELSDQARADRDRDQARRDFDNDQARRDNLASDGIDPSVRDDDFSGDQNTGPGGIL